VFIWPRHTRLIWLVSAIAMHCGIAIFMGLYLFGLIMIVLNIAAFGPLEGDATFQVASERKSKTCAT
jgi:hypothetical protein